MVKMKRNTKQNAEGDSVNDEKGMSETEYRANVMHRWVDFTTEARCYVEGTYLEAGQTVSLPPAAAYRQRSNKNLRMTSEFAWPTLSKSQVNGLTEGNPKVGPAPTDFTLVKPGSVAK